METTPRNIVTVVFHQVISLISGLSFNLSLFNIQNNFVCRTVKRRCTTHFFGLLPSVSFDFGIRGHDPFISQSFKKTLRHLIKTTQLSILNIFYILIVSQVSFGFVKQHKADLGQFD